MYRKAGYTTVKRERERLPPFKMRFLMKKCIAPVAAVRLRQVEATSTECAGLWEGERRSESSGSSVFVWDDASIQDGDMQ